MRTHKGRKPSPPELLALHVQRSGLPLVGRASHRGEPLLWLWSPGSSEHQTLPGLLKESERRGERVRKRARGVSLCGASRQGDILLSTREKDCGTPGPEAMGNRKKVPRLFIRSCSGRGDNSSTTKEDGGHMKEKEVCILQRTPTSPPAQQAHRHPNEHNEGGKCIDRSRETAVTATRERTRGGWAMALLRVLTESSVTVSAAGTMPCSSDRTIVCARVPIFQARGGRSLLYC